ncbi:2-hydroxyacid dehydrogenase [Pseudohaliea rubra]|uniref:D-3-phosphoglycerate dehydrogenase n=1 Tax=Pseudohaliea rubra DSM 19751 TaxID=1265313 RepID=A0A095VSL5_9GAMM|nr:D-glycerate dehydrogenase [Pseudohaliea rubra]KGE04063.1 D-3-phosphoglycerate dehydrogenase [Pseudohaliea rubra DSM 19751]
MSHIYLTHALPGKRIAELGQHCDMDCWSGPGLLPADRLRLALAAADGVVCLLTDRIDAALLAAAPRLRFISSVSVGLDHVDLEAATGRGIPVGHTPGVLVDATADTAFALLLAAARRIAEADAFVRGGHWRPETAWSPDFFLGRDLAGATLGLVGLGAIARAVARRAAAFGMRVVAWNRSPRTVPGVEVLPLDDVLAASDFVSVHVALAPQTRGLLDAQRLAQLRPGAVLINTARGGIVDEAALADALISGHLGGAGLDVYEREPLPAESPLLTAPNTVLAPHIGSATALTRRRMADLAAANALAALRGERMPHCANPAVYE